MKFIVFVVFVVLAVAHAKYLMAPYGLSEALDKNESGSNLVQSATQKETLYIPMAQYTYCHDNSCAAACRNIGYRHGTCIDNSTCRCYN